MIPSNGIINLLALEFNYGISNYPAWVPNHIQSTKIICNSSLMARTQ